MCVLNDYKHALCWHSEEANTHKLTHVDFTPNSTHIRHMLCALKPKHEQSCALSKETNAMHKLSGLILTYCRSQSIAATLHSMK